MNQASQTFDIKKAYIEISRMLALTLAVIAEETEEGFIEISHYNGGMLLSKKDAEKIKDQMNSYICPREIDKQIHAKNLDLFKRTLESFEFCPPNHIHFEEVFAQTNPAEDLNLANPK